MTITDRPDLQEPDQEVIDDDTPLGLSSPMRVKKRDGGLEPVDVNKIVRAVGALRRRASTASIRCASPPAPSAASTTARPRRSSTSCRSARPPR